MAVVDAQHDTAERACGVVPVVKARRRERIDPIESKPFPGRLAVDSTHVVSALLTVEEREPSDVFRVENIIAVWAYKVHRPVLQKYLPQHLVVRTMGFF